MPWKHVKDEFSNADEIDNLCNTKEWSNDQGSAICPFKKGQGTLITPDFPRKRHKEKR